MAKRLTGLNPLSYLGSNSIDPPQTIKLNRDPTTGDYANFNIHALWINTASNDAFILTNKSNGVSTWTRMGGDIATVTGDSGGAISPDSSGNINILGGTNVTTSGSGSSITIDSSAGSGITWSVIAGATQTLAASNGYIANNAGQVDFSLPATASVGDAYWVTGMNNATGWTVTQNAGQTIYFAGTNTTTGVGGSLTSTGVRDTIGIVCVVENTDFQVTASIGNITIV